MARKPNLKRKKIEGKFWSYAQGFTSKKEADEHAERKRNLGLKARVVKGKTVYGLGKDGRRLICYRVYTRRSI